ncbi:MAG: hypothetical protein P4M09_12760 [Devosia sp.]|nr:hypothetical protein [Devosia sp.]
MLRFAAAVTLVSLAISSPAIAAASFGGPQCALSSDKSSIIVTASNPDAKSYRCTAFCRAHITASRPFDNFDCTFNLAKGAAEKVVCTKKGGKPNYYSDVLPSKATCVPR